MVSSKAVCRQVIDLYHIAPERVSYVPLCADAIFTPRPAEEIATVRKQYGLPERYVLYVGTVDPRKDLPRLRSAYELLPPDLADDSALVFVGRVNRGAERLARQLRLPGPRGHVIALDYVPRDVLPAIYSGAAVFSYPSRYEGFGLPVLEAMSCGAPVIVSSADALVELVDQAGVVLRTESVEELTQAIERLLRFDNEQRRSTGRHSRRDPFHPPRGPDRPDDRSRGGGLGDPGDRGTSAAIDHQREPRTDHAGRPRSGVCRRACARGPGAGRRRRRAVGGPPDPPSSARPGGRG